MGKIKNRKRMLTTNAISRLTIKGFKSIRELVDFELRNLNVIVGANGAGKSNFIQVFRMIHAMAQKNLQEFVQTGGGADAFPYNGIKNTPEIYVELSFGQNSWGVTLKPTVDERFSLTERRRYLDYAWSINSGLVESQLEDDKDESSHLHHGVRGVGYYVYNAISRWTVYHFHDTSQSAPMRRTEIVEDCARLRENGSNIAAFLKALREGGEAGRNSYSRIVDAVRLVMPFFDDFVLDVAKTGQSDRVKLTWRQKGSDYPFQPYHLSDGSIRFICLATALLQPDPPSTILIDEPELGLHPTAIGIVAELMKVASSRTQVIAATQSPLLIDRFRFEDVIVARRKDGSTVFDRLKEEDYSAWAEEFSLGELVTNNVIEGGPAYE